MELRLIRLTNVMRKTGLSRATIYRNIGEGTFPRQHHIGLRAVAWTESSIDDWIKERIHGQFDTQDFRKRKGPPMKSKP